MQLKSFSFVLGLTAVIVPLAGVPEAFAQSPAPRSLQMEFHPDGAVTLQAQNVAPREIFMEWARLCGCYVVNADRMPGGPLAYPILFTHQSQDKVLESLLRSAAGYLLTPKRAGNTSASAYETIYILPTTTASAVAASYIQPYSAPAPLTTPGSPDDEIPPITPIPGGGSSGAPRQDPSAARPTPPVGAGVPTRFVPVPIMPVGPSAPATPAAGPGQTTPAPPGQVTVRPAN